jgi:hypothetical protein
MMKGTLAPSVPLYRRVVIVIGVGGCDWKYMAINSAESLNPSPILQRDWIASSRQCFAV